MTWIPLFQGKKQQNRRIQTRRRSNMTLQVIDLFGSDTKFPYDAKQRNFSAQQRNFYG
jgi:hypothetical protein